MVYSCEGWFLFVSLWTRLVLPLVIHSGILAFSRHLLSSRANMLWMDKNPRMSSWLGIFRFRTFLSVALCESWCTSTSGPSLILFYVIHSFSLSVIFFRFPYFTSKLFFFHCIFYLFIGRNFRISCFVCIARFCLGIFWETLVSSISFNLYFQVVLALLSTICSGLFIPKDPCVYCSYFSLLRGFHISVNWWLFTGVSWTLLSILSDLNNAVVWMASTRPLISKSSRPCTKLLVTVPSAPITIDITVIFMFYMFFLIL